MSTKTPPNAPFRSFYEGIKGTHSPSYNRKLSLDRCDHRNSVHYETTEDELGNGITLFTFHMKCQSCQRLWSKAPPQGWIPRKQHSKLQYD